MSAEQKPVTAAEVAEMLERAERQPATSDGVMETCCQSEDSTDCAIGWLHGIVPRYHHDVSRLARALQKAMKALDLAAECWNQEGGYIDVGIVEDPNARVICVACDGSGATSGQVSHKPHCYQIMVDTARELIRDYQHGEKGGAA